jgi:uncharacterized membrane protein (DUF485 family)
MSENRSNKSWIVLVILILVVFFATPALNNFLRSRGVDLGLELNFGDFGFTQTLNNIFSNIANSFKGWGR